MNEPSLATEVTRSVPLIVGASYLNFVSTYGAALVTTLAVLYGSLQIVMRTLEHRAIMRRNKGV